MSNLIDLSYGLDEDGVFVNINNVTHYSYAEVIEKHPELLEPENAHYLAELYYTFSDQQDYFVFIKDVEQYIQGLQRQVEEEISAGTQPFNAFRPRLIDFGVPDYTAIHPPIIQDGFIKYYVHERHSSVPYLVTGSLINQKSVTIEPISLEPVDIDLIKSKPFPLAFIDDSIFSEAISASDIESLTQDILTSTDLNDDFLSSTDEIIRDLVNIEVDALLSEYHDEGDDSLGTSEDLGILMKDLDALLAKIGQDDRMTETSDYLDVLFSSSESTLNESSNSVKFDVSQNQHDCKSDSEHKQDD